MAILPRSATDALTQTHRRKFTEDLRQKEEQKVEKLVDTQSPLWQSLQSIDEPHWQMLKTDNPNRQVDPNLPPEWSHYATKALIEKDITPGSVHFIEEIEPNVPASANIRTYHRYNPFDYYPRLIKTEQFLEFNPSLYDEKIAPLTHKIRKSILSHIAQHEATHISEGHALTSAKIDLYHKYHGTTPDETALVEAQEKTAETFPALKSRKGAERALITQEHDIGYPETNPDIRVEKSYWDVQHLKDQQEHLKKSAQEWQRKLQYNPVNRAITRWQYGIGRTQSPRTQRPIATPVSIKSGE